MPLFGAPGQRIGYEVYPHPLGAPPLFLVHGFTASSASFVANLDGLRQHFTVVTVELLGHGASDAPEDPAAYAPGPAMERLANLMDHLGYRQVLLCGHSLGGALALRFALDAPERLSGLVVINSSSAAGSPQWRENAHAGMAGMAARVRAEGTGFLKSTRLYPAHSRRLDPISKDLLTRDFDRIQPAGLAGTAEALVVDVNAYERHGELQVPMLLVVGDRDTDFAPSAPGFAARFPEGMVRVVHLAEAGHAANIEQPREFEAAVTRFARFIGYLAPSGVPRRQGRGAARLMMSLGGVLVVAGIGLLAAAIFLNGGDDNGGQPVIAAPEPEETRAPATPTPGEATAGTRTSPPVNVGGASASATAAAASATAASATSVATATVTATTAPATPTTVPAVQPAPTSTPTPEPTATPTPVPTPTEEPTPAGPVARISGPTTAEVGVPAPFSDNSSPVSEVLTQEWSTPSGVVRHSVGIGVTFPAAGCYTISLTTYFRDGQVRFASQAVSVGGVSCN